MRKELRIPKVLESNNLLLLRVTLWISAAALYLDAVNSKNTLPEWVIAEMMIFSGAMVTASVPDWGKDMSVNHTPEV